MTSPATCAAPGCDKRLWRGNQSGLCRGHAAGARMKALCADPKFMAIRCARHSALMTVRHADPRHNPLVLLSVSERADYDLLKRARLTRAEALSAVGRADLIRGATA